MLGEIHTLAHDFPELEDRIIELIKTNDDFAVANKSYNQLDKEIRTLELNGSPIEDSAMVQLKLDRAEMKDALYQVLETASA